MVHCGVSCGYADGDDSLNGESPDIIRTPDVYRCAKRVCFVCRINRNDRFFLWLCLSIKKCQRASFPTQETVVLEH